MENSFFMWRQQQRERKTKTKKKAIGMRERGEQHNEIFIHANIFILLRRRVCFSCCKKKVNRYRERKALSVRGWIRGSP